MSRYLENVAVGLVYIIIPACFLFINTLAMIAISRDKALFKWPSYKVMTSMILTDSIQLLGILVNGSVTVGSAELSYYSLKVIGGITNAFWIINLTQGCILAITRCSAIFHIGESLFQGLKVFIWLGLSYLYGFVYLVLYMTPYVNIFYDLVYYDLSYDSDYGSLLVQQIEFVSDWAENVFMVLAYIVITAKFCLNKHQTGATELNKKEKNAILQSFIVCFSLISTTLTWNVLPALIDGKWPTFASTVFWAISSGIYTYTCSNFKVQNVCMEIA